MHPFRLFPLVGLLAGCSSAPDMGMPDADAGPIMMMMTDAGDAGPPQPIVIFPRTGIDGDQLAVIINDMDPLSVAVASYYVTARKIANANVVHVQIANMGDALTSAEFDPIKKQVDAALADHVQAMLLTWTKPYRVENMSITSAFALGFVTIGDTCNDPNSQGLKPNPYAKQPFSTQPFTDLQFRPAMLLPATTIEEAKAIIDHGVASDNTSPQGNAYMMLTSDKVRSARCILDPMYGYTNECQQLIDVWDQASTGIGAGITMADSIQNKNDVLFYVQGLASVPNIKTNQYPPGAIADHLTSYGGQIPTSGQMSAFEFLRAGATASFGTTVEPCAYQQKFPNPAVYVPRYFGGATLIEAYWKSVVWPAEGIFLGEPLARPFPGYTWKLDGDMITIVTTAMVPKAMYVIEAGDSVDGPFTTVLDNLSVTKYSRMTFHVPTGQKVYRFTKL